MFNRLVIKIGFYKDKFRIIKLLLVNIYKKIMILIKENLKRVTLF